MTVRTVAANAGTRYVAPIHTYVRTVVSGVAVEIRFGFVEARKTQGRFPRYVVWILCTTYVRSIHHKYGATLTYVENNVRSIV